MSNTMNDWYDEDIVSVERDPNAMVTYIFMILITALLILLFIIKMVKL